MARVRWSCFPRGLCIYYTSFIRLHIPLVVQAPSTIFFYLSSRFIPDHKRWSRSVAQFNFISFCLEEVQGKWFGLQKLPYINKLLGEYPYLTCQYVLADLQEAIFQQLREKGHLIKDNYNTKSCKKLLAYRGDYVLEKIYKLDEFSWSIVCLEFDRSLLVWHIATEICYCLDFDDGHRIEITLPQKCKISKCVSDYMLYLLALLPPILPKGIGEIRYKETCAQIKQFLRRTKSGNNRRELCKNLFDRVSRRPIIQSVISDGSELSDGCKLVKELVSLDWSREKKWKMISEVWIEMLTYAACQCGRKGQAQRLCEGGELLTHVWLLMTHLGLHEVKRLSLI